MAADAPPASERGLGSRFRLLLTAAGISNLGDGVYQAALPLLVASITRDPLLVAGAFVAAQLPWLLFALVSGALVDRIDRRRAMVRLNLLRGVAVGALGLAAMVGQVEIWLIYLTGFLLATAETVFDPATEAVLPRLVRREGLAAANGRLQGVTWAGNSFVGPPIGAALFVVATGLPFLVDALTFIVSALLIAAIPGSFAAAAPAGPRESLRREIRGGLSFLVRHPVLRWTTPMAGVTNLASFSIIAIFVLYVQDVLGLDAVGYGLLISALGLGGLFGALVAGRVIGRIGTVGAIRLSPLIGAASTAVFVLFPVPIFVAVAMATFAFQITLWNVAVITLRQQLVPDAMRGRIAGASRLVTWGMQPVGAVVGGVIATAFGLGAPFVFACAILTAMAVVTVPIITPELIASATRRALEQETAVATATERPTEPATA